VGARDPASHLGGCASPARSAGLTEAVLEPAKASSNSNSFLRASTAPRGSPRSPRLPRSPRARNDSSTQQHTRELEKIVGWRASARRDISTSKGRLLRRIMAVIDQQKRVRIQTRFYAPRRLPEGRQDRQGYQDRQELGTTRQRSNTPENSRKLWVGALGLGAIFQRPRASASSIMAVIDQQKRVRTQTRFYAPRRLREGRQDRQDYQDRQELGTTRQRSTTPENSRKFGVPRFGCARYFNVQGRLLRRSFVSECFGHCSIYFHDEERSPPWIFRELIDNSEPKSPRGFQVARVVCDVLRAWRSWRPSGSRFK